MNTKQIITITVAALFLIGGATAVGAAAPADQAPDTASDAHAENTDDVDSNTDTADSQAPVSPAAGVGPSDGLPEQVPSHVSSILDTIKSFQNGGIDNLGESLSSLLGGGLADNAVESGA